MIITWAQILVLSPLLIIGLTVLLIMLSISYRRNQFIHATCTIVGLGIVLILSIYYIYKNQNFQNFLQLIFIDNFSALYTILVMITSIASSLSIYTWLLRYPTNYRDEFYLLLLLSSMGGVLLTTANHLVTLFIGIELVTIPVFGLISYSFFQKCSIETSIKYIILSGISSSFFLFGIAFVYAATGHLSFVGIKEILLTYHDYDTEHTQFMLLIIIGLSMMMVGFSFKLSFVPFHFWIPDVYQGAPSAVSMYLATGSKIAIISALIRFLLILPEEYNKMFYIFLSGSACCSMLLGSIMAVYQNSIKRILAYSSVTNAGYLLVALISLYISPFSIQESVGIYLISYMFSNIGAFGIISIMSASCIEKDADMLTIYRGLFWREPVLTIIFTVMILSLAGIPITLGFIGKLYILLAGIYHKLWWLVVFIVISSIISIFYYLKIIINLYLQPINNNIRNYDGKCVVSSWSKSPDGIVSIIIAIIILVFGLYPHPIIQLINLTCIR